MEGLTGLINLILFYVCMIAFFWNFNTFTFQEKIIVMLIFSGIQCLSVIYDKKSDI